MNRIKSTCGTIVQSGIITELKNLKPVPSGIPVVYEVIRVKAGIPLFVEAHLARMNRSLTLAGFPETLNIHTVKESIHVLTEACSISDQNIRLNVWQSDGHTCWSGMFVDSVYPSAEVYRQGVATGFLNMERSNPNAKVWQGDIKEAVTKQCTMRNLYEMILVDANDVISEGSRSNLFFTQGNTLITAPDEAVLEGITRLKLLELAEKMKIPLIKREIHVSELESFDGAFITGTSIHLLPVSKIDLWERQSSEQPLIKHLMDQFENAVKEYETTYTYE